jgi:hypothetical protein
MFRNPEQIRQRLQEIAEKFRQKGATSPERALTIQELEPPPRFEQAMNRRLGQSGIFVETNGKYYLNEERLKQIQEQRSKMAFQGGGWNQGHSTWYRAIGILLLLPIGIIVAVALFFIFGFNGGYGHGEYLILLLVVLLIVFVARFVFWS